MCLPPRSFVRSDVPITTASSRVWPAWTISSALSMPIGVSIIAHTPTSLGTPMSSIARMVSSTVFPLSTLGSTIAAGRAALMTLKSSLNHSVSTPFSRTTTSLCAPNPALTAAAAASRASGLTLGATASSRSMDMTSVAMPLAFSRALGLEPGMKRTLLLGLPLTSKRAL
eukprot:CAMPEP_0173398338 /NCGR_PEP_ID=MMETSP1356-20130122/41219_1 /TAXON_ID=77927 ORGANISM="Hemiselmis virescens, Strain PCC157" /NCGR_SAMPLE_ID=MMETSP1356 /ASSEMBLY_ACC=CAM_ASM_000847 /LENGTH=169 /DNA_ID=CAMNT_0014357803 /DNA_START=349 /DNA_END=858 /DNA_ORIENTATION=-